MPPPKCIDPRLVPGRFPVSIPTGLTAPSRSPDAGPGAKPLVQVRDAPDLVAVRSVPLHRQAESRAPERRGPRAHRAALLEDKRCFPSWPVAASRATTTGGRTLLLSKLTRSILVAGLLVAGVVVSPWSQSPASAAYCVAIHRIYYNSPGTDTGSNSSLNAEWIQLRNRCSTSRSLTNWKIKDAAGHAYTFGTYALGGGKYVKVDTGKGTKLPPIGTRDGPGTCGTRTRRTSTTKMGPGSTRAPTTTDPLARPTVSRSPSSAERRRRWL